MHRGELHLNGEELTSLVSNIRFDNNPFLGEKFHSAVENIQLESNQIFVSEEELEYLLDEIGGRSEEDLVLLRKELSETLIKIRGQMESCGT